MIMARFRKSLAMRPVNRIKHVIDLPFNLPASTTVGQTLVGATDTPTLVVTSSVETGATVNGVYLRVEIAADETVTNAIPQVYMAVYKDPGGNLTTIDPHTVGANDNKRFVIHQEMIMFQNAEAGNPRTLFNGVIVIPKGYKRFGPNDKLIATFRSTAIDIKVCIQSHYKEFR